MTGVQTCALPISSATDLPDGAEIFAVDAELAFPARNQSRTAVRMMIAVTTVEVERMTSRGEGVATLPDGMTVFVPRTVPGDRVSIEVTETRRRWARGRVVSVPGTVNKVVTGLSAVTPRPLLRMSAARVQRV